MSDFLGLLGVGIITVLLLLASATVVMVVGGVVGVVLTWGMNAALGWSISLKIGFVVGVIATVVGAT